MGDYIQRRNEILEEIRKLDILIANHRKQLSQTEDLIKSFDMKRQEYYKELNFSIEGYDVT